MRVAFRHANSGPVRATPEGKRALWTQGVTPCLAETRSSPSSRGWPTSSDNCSIQALNDNLVLLESGLDSLCFAIIVARLEDELGYDPFTASEDVYFPVTLGDFVEFYDQAA